MGTTALWLIAGNVAPLPGTSLSPAGVGSQSFQGQGGIILGAG